MVDLLSDKQYKEIITTIKKKVNILQNKYKKQNRRYLHETNYQIIKKLQKRIVHTQKKNENKKSGEIKMREKPVRSKKNLPYQNAINLTNIKLNQHQQS